MGADIAKVENPKGGEALPAEAVIEDHDLIGSPLPLAYEPGARPALGQGVHLDRLGQVRTGLPAGGRRIRTTGPSRVEYLCFGWFCSAGGVEEACSVCFSIEGGPTQCIKNLISLCEFPFRWGPDRGRWTPTDDFISVDLPEC